MSYATMYAEVLNVARQSGTWATARVKAHLNEAQEDIWREAKEFTQLEKTSTASAVAGQANYSLPSDFIRIKEMEITHSGTTYTGIKDVGWVQVNQELADTSNDIPTAYTIHYQQLWFNRTFAATDTIRMTYFYSPADMSDDADTSPLPERILVQYAIAMIMRDLGREQSHQLAYTLYTQMKEQYITSDGRSDDKFYGFYDGADGVHLYWAEGKLIGG